MATQGKRIKSLTPEEILTLRKAARKARKAARKYLDALRKWREFDDEWWNEFLRPDFDEDILDDIEEDRDAAEAEKDRLKKEWDDAEAELKELHKKINEKLKFDTDLT